MSSDPNYEWERLLDIDDFNLPLTPVLRPCNSHVRKTTTTTKAQNTAGSVQVEETPVRIIIGHAGVVQVEEKPVRIIPGPAGIVQLAKLRKQSDIHEGHALARLSLLMLMVGGIVNGCLGDIENYLKNGKFEQVVAMINSSIDEEGYRKDIIVGSALILANVFVFSPKPLMHYLNITKRNVVKVFHKDSVAGNDSGVGGSGMLMEEEKIVKLIEEEMVDFGVAAKGGGALGLSRALKPSTHLVIAIFLYPLRAEVEVDFALEVQVVGALDLVEALKVEVEAMVALDLVEVGARDLVEGALDLVELEATCLVGALDVVGLSLNILISASVSGYLTSLNKTTSSSPKQPSSLESSS
ncbi:hypothetical protein Tco_0919984 [Tanacetum coccineum]